MKKRRLQYPPWLTVQEFMEMMQIKSKDSVYEMLRKGQIPHVKVGSHYRIDRDGVFMTARGQFDEVSAMRQRVGA